ncbi:DUF4412 domain-containing protein [Sabulilitoribacter multivorans]|uniref:DUF4412 domain-containing protein n=1 Tax=Flaviramulus multivorans TaxID=1304750 RepID=A0ABS9IMC6_9FLAO|nr:DUF4412 domain-containing protein [Flaviramulus multivorans]MCF7561728.1 DUF4412 domain-containing protein [Flaviramulus multivorans]
MNTKNITLIVLSLCFSMSVMAQDPTKKIMQGLMGKNKLDTKKLPDVYEFDWEFKTEIKTGKDETMQMNYLINSDSKDYFGLQMSSEELKGKGTMQMVMDSKEKVTVMYMDMNGQKMAQMNKMPEQKANKNNPKYSYKEIGTKTILGFTCYGMQIENGDYINDIYFTLDAPVNFSAFFAFANNKNAPKGFDPALLQVLEEDALLMEMTGTHKKKSKNNFTMTAISLEEKNTEIKKEDYQFMSFGMGF